MATASIELEVCDGKSGSLLVEGEVMGKYSHMSPEDVLREEGVLPQSYEDSVNGESETPFYYAFTHYLRACTGWVRRE